MNGTEREIARLAKMVQANQMMLWDLMRILTEDEGVNPVRCADAVRDAAKTAFRVRDDGEDLHKAEREAFLQWADTHERLQLGRAR